MVGGPVTNVVVVDSASWDVDWVAIDAKDDARGGGDDIWNVEAAGLGISVDP